MNVVTISIICNAKGLGTLLVEYITRGYTEHVGRLIDFDCEFVHHFSRWNKHDKLQMDNTFRH